MCLFLVFKRPSVCYEFVFLVINNVISQGRFKDSF